MFRGEGGVDPTDGAVIRSYLKWVRFERPAALFPDVEAEGSRHMIHAWEVIDTEFKKYQDEEADRRAKQKSEASSYEPEDEDDEVPAGTVQQFPRLKHNYRSIS